MINPGSFDGNLDGCTDDSDEDGIIDELDITDGKIEKLQSKKKLSNKDVLLLIKKSLLGLAEEMESRFKTINQETLLFMV